MRKYCFAIICVGFFIFVSLGSAAETAGILSDKGWEVSGDLNFSSLYMWRGMTLDEDPVVQPGIYIKSPVSKFGRIKLGFWMSRDLRDKDALKSAENDYIFDYTYSFESFDASFGHTYYDFPDLVPADGASRGFSREFYWGVTFGKVFLSPGVFYYYDYGRKEEGGGQGSYLVLNLAHSIPFKAGAYALSLDLSGHIAYNNKFYYQGKGGDAAIGAGVTIPLAKSLNLKPNVNYGIPWGNVSDKYNGNQKDRFYGGVYLNYVF